MAYVHQWGEEWHYTYPFSGITLCSQYPAKWKRTAYYSKDLKSGEALCQECRRMLENTVCTTEFTPRPEGQPALPRGKSKGAGLRRKKLEITAANIRQILRTTK